MKTNRRNAVAALIAAGLLWGTTVPLSKLALAWLSPGWLTVIRFGLAAAVLLAAMARRSAGRRALRAACTPAVLIAGALGYGGSVIVQNAGITRTSVTHAALLIGAVPVLVAIIAAAWYRTVARPVAWFGFAVSLAGVGLVTAGGGGGGATMAGDGLVLASLFLSATVTVAQGRLLIGRDPAAVTAVQFLGATLGALPVALLTEGAPAVPGGAGPVLAAVTLALAGTLLPFTLFAFGQSRVSAEVAGAFLNLEPLVGAIAGAAAFGDPVGLPQVAGGGAILTGIGLSSLPLFAARRAEVRRQAAGVGALAPAGKDVSAPASVAPGVPAGAEGRSVPAGAEALVPAGVEAPGAKEVVLAGSRPTGADTSLSTGTSLGGARSAGAQNSGTQPAGARPARRSRVPVVVYGGKFGPGGPDAVTGPRPRPGRPGSRRRGRARSTRPGPGHSRSGGRAAGRPPARRFGVTAASSDRVAAAS
jgi:O-acetylserine/cysteine efflux transporter